MCPGPWLPPWCLCLLLFTKMEKDSHSFLPESPALQVQGSLRYLTAAFPRLPCVIPSPGCRRCWDPRFLGEGLGTEQGGTRPRSHSSGPF